MEKLEVDCFVFKTGRFAGSIKYFFVGSKWIHNLVVFPTQLRKSSSMWESFYHFPRFQPEKTTKQ